MKSATERTAVVNRLLAKAARLYRSGQRADAIGLYEKAIIEAPDHAGAHNLLGLAYAQNGEPERAVPILEKAITLDPNLLSCHYNVGTILQQLKRYESARQHFEIALAKQPGDAELHSNLGAVLRFLGQTEQAIDHLSKAIRLNPRYAAGYFNLGNALREQLRHEEAYAAFAAAIALEPSRTETHASAGYELSALHRYGEALVCFDRAIALKGGLSPQIYLDRGKVLYHLRRYADALASYDRALQLHPDLPDVYISASATLNRVERYDEALEKCQRVLALRPRDISARANMVTSLWGLRRYDEALVLAQEVLAEQPDLGTVHFAIADVYDTLGRGEEALRSYERAIEYLPDDLFGQLNKGLCDLSMGRFKEGWPLFENRWIECAEQPRRYPQPVWGGDALTGPLLVWGEQGIGDQVLFASMIDDLRARVPSLRIEVESRLVPLFARSFPAVDVMAKGDDLYTGPIAAHMAFASIGHHLRPDWASFKKPPPAYLRADPARAAELRKRLATEDQCVIGLSWQSANYKVGAAKTAYLQDFASVLRIPGCRFIDLQYGDTQEQRRSVFEELGVNVERLDDVDTFKDIDGLAALISACDLVVTVSNTTAHLAGALGKPTWVFLPFGRGRFWYWMKDGEDSPWYPRVRIKRRLKDQSWSDLIALAAPEISATAAKR